MCTGGPARGNAACSWVSWAIPPLPQLLAPASFFPFLSLLFFPGFHGKKSSLLTPCCWQVSKCFKHLMGLSVSPQAGGEKSCSSQRFRGEKLLLPHFSMLLNQFQKGEKLLLSQPFHDPKCFCALKPIPKWLPKPFLASKPVPKGEKLLLPKPFHDPKSFPAPKPVPKRGKCCCSPNLAPLTFPCSPTFSCSPTFPCLQSFHAPQTFP